MGIEGFQCLAPVHWYNNKPNTSNCTGWDPILCLSELPTENLSFIKKSYQFLCAHSIIKFCQTQRYILSNYSWGGGNKTCTFGVFWGRKPVPKKCSLLLGKN